MKEFQKNQEDFTCDNCDHFVEGSGYTNHCPECLWGKHVDINPGDRQEDCHGAMESINVEEKGEGYVILHRCTKCNFERKNKTQPNDNFDKITELSTN